MYDATTRNTYAMLVKAAEASLPQYVRDAAVKLAGRDPLLQAELAKKLGGTA